jgi:hypothetical protein
MSAVGKILTFAPILLVGCRATHDVASTSYHVTRGAAVGSYKVARAVAVGSYRVATAPVHYATRKRGDESSTMVGTETLPSDVTNPGEAIPPPETAAAPQPRVEAERRQTRTSGATSRTSRGTTAQSSANTSASHAPSSQATFPTGKPVPDKPGYVFSPFDKEGRYVDVSGFPSGTKVKDPWTDKIFLVP